MDPTRQFTRLYNLAEPHQFTFTGTPPPPPPVDHTGSDPTTPPPPRAPRPSCSRSYWLISRTNPEGCSDKINASAAAADDKLNNPSNGINNIWLCATIMH